MSTQLYLPSNNVSVFPFSSMRTTDPASHLLNEHNLTRLIQKLTDYPSYILSCDYLPSAYHLEFVIEGYYYDVTIPKEDLLGMTKCDIYAQAPIVQDAYNYKYLYGGDYTEIGGGSGTSDFPYIVQRGTTEFRIEQTAWFKYPLKANQTVTIIGNLATTLGVMISNVYTELDADNAFYSVNIVTNTVTAKQDFELIVKASLPAEIKSETVRFVSEGETNTVFTGLNLVPVTLGTNFNDAHSLHILSIDASGKVTTPIDSFHRIQPMALDIDVIQCTIPTA